MSVVTYLPTRYLQLSTVWLAQALGVLIFLTPITAMGAEADRDLLAAATDEASTVIIAVIHGLADTDPQAQLRRARELHLVDVELTLKGRELSGQRLALRPRMAGWVDGERFLIFLKDELPNGALVEVLQPQPVQSASAAAVKAARGLIAATGEGVTPRLSLWATLTLAGGPVSALQVYETGKYQRWPYPLERGVDASECGVLAEGELDELRDLISNTKVSTPSDDAAQLAFHWLDDDFHVHSLLLEADSVQGQDLLQSIQRFLALD